MTEPNQRAELERLRKMKRLRELEAKAGGSQQASPGLGVTPAAQGQMARRSPQSVLNEADSFVRGVDQLTGDQMLREKQRIYPGSSFQLGSYPDGRPQVTMLPENALAVPSKPKDTIGKGTERWIAQVNGSTFGFADDVARLMGQGAAAQEFERGLDQARDKRPMETMGIEMLSSLPAGFAGSKAVQPVLNVSQRPLLGGAAGGGLYGYGDADEDNKLAGASIGAVSGGIFGKLGEGAFNAGDGLRRRVRSQPSDGQRAADQFGVRMTRGQATNDLDQIAFEQAAARGGRGPDATQVLRPFMDEQKQAVTSAGKALAGDQFAEINEAGAFVKEGLMKKAGTAQQEIRALYEQAESAGAKMRSEGVSAMPDAVRQALPDDVKFLMAAPSEEARRTMPAAMQAMDAVQRLKSEVSSLNSQGVGSVGAVDFKRIEVARRAINSSIDAASNNSDRRAAMSVKRAFDGYIDGAVDAALFEGDEAFLDAYKTARAARAEFAEKFEANKVFDRLVKADPSPEQTLEYILGAHKIAPTEQVRKVVPQIRRALGDDSPEWAALQEAAIKRVMKQTEKTYNPKVLRDNLDELLTGRNQTVAEELFTPEQYSRLRQFRGTVDRLIPPDGAVNYSGTSYDIQRSLSQEAARIFNFPGGQTFKALVTKYLPDRNLARAQMAVSDGALSMSPKTALPTGFAPLAGVAGEQTVGLGLRQLGLDN